MLTDFADFRRYFRPFFLDPKTQAPLPSKKYYDLFSWLVTQLTFSFATTPFLILTLSGSLAAWSRLYFYAVIGTLASMAFFASPAKPALRKALEQRAARIVHLPAESDRGAKGREELTRTMSMDSIKSREPVLGLSSDLERDFDEVMDELKSEVQARRTSVNKAGVKAA